MKQKKFLNLMYMFFFSMIYFNTIYMGEGDIIMKFKELNKEKQLNQVKLISPRDIVIAHMRTVVKASAYMALSGGVITLCKAIGVSLKENASKGWDLRNLRIILSSSFLVNRLPRVFCELLRMNVKDPNFGLNSVLGGLSILVVNNFNYMNEAFLQREFIEQKFYREKCLPINLLDNLYDLLSNYYSQQIRFCDIEITASNDKLIEITASNDKLKEPELNRHQEIEINNKLVAEKKKKQSFENTLKIIENLYFENKEEYTKIVITMIHEGVKKANSELEQLEEKIEAEVKEQYNKELAEKAEVGREEELEGKKQIFLRLCNLMEKKSS